VVGPNQGAGGHGRKVNTTMVGAPYRPSIWRRRCRFGAVCATSMGDWQVRLYLRWVMPPQSGRTLGEPSYGLKLDDGSQGG
jgi:hypothetical protein